MVCLSLSIPAAGKVTTRQFHSTPEGDTGRSPGKPHLVSSLVTLLTTELADLAEKEELNRSRDSSTQQVIACWKDARPGPAAALHGIRNFSN